MLILGLTGASGSGKSSVSNLFSNLGAIIIDADKIYADLLLNHRPMIDEIAENFDVLIENQIDRKKLREIVFLNKEKLNLLNKITHKYVLEQIFLEINHANDKNIVILDVPLLFEANLENKCHKILGVIANEDVKISRICKRDGIFKEDAIKRLKNQKNNDFFIKNCDIIIENSEDFEKLKSNCKKIYKDLGEYNGKQIKN